MKVQVNPLTVNQAYTGRRFKTPQYRQYVKDVTRQLTHMRLPDGALELYIQLGVSNKNRDVDNCAKPFIDILQKRYDFNDSRIYHLSMMKRIVPKGEEYISFSIHEFIEDLDHVPATLKEQAE